MSAKFSIGEMVATPGALALCEETNTSLLMLVARHQSGDWGDVSTEDARENELSVAQGFRILSSYHVGEERLWVITEADRSVTTVLRPDEY